MNGINEIMFDDMSTYEDFGLLMTGRTIGSAPVKKKMLDVPWRDGVLDYTRSQGRAFYGNRSIAFVFKLVEPDNFYTVYSELAEYLHGRFRRVTIPEDPSYFYYGLCELSELEVSKSIGKITITVDAEPYKYSKSMSDEEIRWDDVNFEETIFRYIGTLSVSGTTAIIIQGGGQNVVPVFDVSSITSNTLTVKSSRNNKTYTLHQGRNRFPDLDVCGASNVTLTFTGTASLNVVYKESRL